MDLPVLFSSQEITLSTKQDSLFCKITFVFASTSTITRREFVSKLSDILSPDPWSVIGDFNAVLGTHENRSCRIELPVTIFIRWLWFDSLGFLIHGQIGGGVLLAWRLDDLYRLAQKSWRSLCLSVVIIPWLMARLGFKPCGLITKDFREVVANCWNSTTVHGCPI